MPEKIVKPCPGEKRSEQGFAGPPVRGDLTGRGEYRGNKTILQTNTFN